jgi:uncharacterized protein (TIGR04255 family)
MARSEGRVVFRNGNRLMMVAPNTLSLHCAPPYEGWESLLKRTQAALHVYESVVGIKAVERVGLRYLNQVTVPAQTFNLDEYFQITQVLPPEFGDSLNAFVDRTSLTWNDIPASMTFTWGTVDSDAPGSTFILDFDLSWPQTTTVEQAMINLAELRKRERRSFEAVIGERLRVMFDADSGSE